MNVVQIMTAVGTGLSGLADVLEAVGDVVNARKVRDILDSGDFPGFARRAAAAGDKAKEDLDHG